MLFAELKNLATPPLVDNYIDGPRTQWVYKNCPLFDNAHGKDNLASFYEQHGKEGIEVLYIATLSVMESILKSKSGNVGIGVSIIDIFGFATSDNVQFKNYLGARNVWLSDCYHMSKANLKNLIRSSR